MRIGSSLLAVTAGCLIGSVALPVRADSHHDARGSTHVEPDLDNNVVTRQILNQLRLPVARRLGDEAHPLSGQELRQEVRSLIIQNRALIEGAALQFEHHAQLVSDLCQERGGGRICPNLDEKIVFITSTAHYGTLPGVAAADFYCNVRAVSAGLTGYFKAWISDSPATEPAATFTHPLVPYVRVDGAVVADNWEALTSEPLQSPIRIDENGNQIDVVGPSVANSTRAWTATTSDGHHRAPLTTNDGMPVPVDCDDWTSSSNLETAPVVLGGYGWSGATNEKWSTAPEPLFGADFGMSCARQAHLYCFEQ